MGDGGTLVELLRARAGDHGDEGAFIFLADGERDEQRLTYGELDRRARAVAASLQQKLRPGDRALLLYPPGLDYVAGFFGCLYAGVIAVPAYPPDPARLTRTLPRLLSIAADARTAAVLTTSTFTELAEGMFALAPELAKLSWIAAGATAGAGGAAGAEASWRDPGVRPEDTAFLQYTSGSTAAPRGVVLSHANVLHNLGAIRRAFRMDRSTVGVIWLPPYHDMGLIGGILTPVFARSETVLMPPLQFLQQPLRWLSAISRYRGAVSGGPNFAFDLCVRKVPPDARAALDLSCWEVAFSGAEPVRAATLARFCEAFGACGFQRRALFPCYGLAEATLMAAGSERGQGPQLCELSAAALERNEVGPPAGEQDRRVLVGCGPSIADQELRIVDPVTAAPCPPARVGEIWVRGPSVAARYFGGDEGRDEPAADVMRARLPDGSGPYLRTGDLGFIEGGQLHVTGRLKDLLILRGRNVYPQDLEQAAEGAHPSLRPGGSAAFGVEAGGEEVLVVACEVDRSQVEASAEELERAAGAVRIAVAEVAGCAPLAVALLRPGSLPKTSSGKVQRHLCSQAFHDGTLGWGALLISEIARGREPVPPRDELEARLAGAFAEVLGAADLGVHDHFFELGGQSILAAELCRRISESLGIELSLTTLFDHPTVALLASAIRAMAPGQGRVPAGLPQLVPAPEERHQPFPLTELQEAYWIGRSPELVLGNVATHVYAEHEVGALELPRLEEAWRRVVARHEMLRAIVLRDGTQRILPQVPPYSIDVTDLRGRPAAEAEQRLLAIRAELSHQLLPPDRWPLFDLRATRLPGGSTRLHLSVDLLMVDLRSAEILLRELALFYQANDAPLPPLEVSFRDYVLAMERAQGAPRMQRAREYWMGRLADLPGGPDLPLSRSPEAVARPRFARRSARLDPAAAARLQRRASRAGLTVSTTLLRAFAEVLAAWSRTPRFTISVTLFHRLPIHPQVNDLVGDFTSLTLLVVDLSSRRPFEVAARETQRQLWRDLDHQLFGGVRVIRERARTHGPASMPVAFTSAPGMRGEDAAPARRLLGDPVFMVSQTSQIWLDHQARWVDGALDLSWDAVEELFPPGMLDAMFQAYQGLVWRLAGPDADQAWAQPARELVPSGQLEARRRANATAGDVQQGLLQDGFWRWAVEQPERTAVMAPDRIVSYRELGSAAASIAARLRDRGVQRDDLVAVVMDRGWEQVAAVLGILGAGAAYLPVDASLPEERRAHLLERGQAKLALTQPWLRKSLAWPEGLSTLPVTEGDLHVPAEAPPSPAGPQDLAYVIFTSGSTGRPKGVMVEHRAALNTIADVNQRFRVGPEDRVLALSSLSFDLSVWDVFGVLEAGGAVVVPDREQAKDAGHWLDLVERARVTVWNTVPALMELLVEQAEAHRRRLPEALRLVMLSGDWIPLSLPERIRALGSPEVVSLGGATEAAIWSVLHRIDRIDPAWRSVPYGKPMRNQTLHVLGPGLEPRPELVPGELYIGGASLARGYWRDEERTRERFVTHPRTGERLYRTGDLARYLPGGDLELLGRQDLQVKVQGHRIELGEVEAVLRQYRGVQGVVAAAVGAGQARRLVAWVVPSAPGAAPTVDELRKYAETQLPAYMVPSAVVLMSRFPLSSNGKVDRSALPAPGVTGHAGSGGPPQGRTEAEIAGLFRALFEREEVDRDDHFFELGGNSILASRLAMRLRDHFRIDFPIRLVFIRPTVAGLAAEVERALRGEEESRSQLDLRVEAELDPEIVPGPPPPARKLGAVFLTGATGFIGSHLLAELLARTEARVVCLVRAENDLEASARLQDAMARNLLPFDVRAVRRVRALAGDLERPLFGLPEAEFRALGREMDAVVHCAASTNLLLPYEALRGTNVVGTRDCIRLACAERRKPLELVSSIGALLSRDLPHGGPLDEDSEIEDGNSILGGYPQTKWVAERLVKAAAARGLEARIHRPAIVTPHSQSGARGSDRDAFTTLLRAMVAVGAVPDLDLELNLVPVDFVASAIVALMLRGPAGGSPPGTVPRCHLATGVPLHLGGVRQLLQRRGFELDLVPFREWCGRALQHAQRAGDEALEALIPGLTERIGDRTLVEAMVETLAALRVGCRRTGELLAREGISTRGAPELLSSYLDLFVRQNVLPRPRLAG